MNGQSVSRRGFLSAAALSAAEYRSLARQAPANRIRVGMIGLGGMGTGRLREFLAHADVDVPALCDVDASHLARAHEYVTKTRSTTPDVYSDFRRVLDRKDIDAVMVATPDHWHALPTVEACKAGKDVFVEKPLSYSIAEGRAMVEAAARHKRVTQMGNHIHNDLPNYRRVVELVRSGLLGDVRRVYCWVPSGDKPMPESKAGPPPKELDYEFWLGPAPRRTFDSNRAHHTYRYFWDYSGGAFIDFFCHITDVVYWALGLTAPTAVSAAGSRFFGHGGRDNGETPNIFEAIYEYPNLLLSWTLGARGMAGFEGYGIGAVFQGTDATLVTTYGHHEVYVRGKQVTDFKRPEPSIPDSPGHIREFLDAIKSRAETTCNVAYSHQLTKAGHLANIALRSGRRIRWDDARERILNDSQAQQLVSRRYHKPWKLSV